MSGGVKVLILLLALALAQPAWGRDRVEWGDDISDYMMSCAVAWTVIYEGGLEGAAQLGLSYTAVRVATNKLKVWTNRKRPDWQPGDAQDAFPSLHSSKAFAPAFFIHKRYGFRQAIVPYALASFTAYTRIHANKHDWVDVAGSIALSGLFTSMFVREYERTPVPSGRLAPDFFPWAPPSGGLGLGVHLDF
ncbi:MAG: phosphatase PAP2 family protein [Desulfovibrionaceae bacterium]|nr:phosphatase PAP2 family protein [Desulfovibrionaceae bacterium]